MATTVRRVFYDELKRESRIPKIEGHLDLQVTQSARDERRFPVDFLIRSGARDNKVRLKPRFILWRRW
jgi:hypothetical protein